MTHFGIGLYKPNHKPNIGTLWRSAYLLGADYIFIIDSNWKFYRTDTQKTWKQIPAYLYSEDSWTIPIDTKLIGIEMSPEAIPLPGYTHFKRAMYILGNENSGLPLHIQEKCDSLIQIPSMRQQSYNVSMAGTLVMYDRMIKNTWKERD